jgi:hypothetical protein
MSDALKRKIDETLLRSKALDANMLRAWQLLRREGTDGELLHAWHLLRQESKDVEPKLDWTGCDYRTMPGTKAAPPTFVQVNRREWMRRSWIASIAADGTITRTDGVRVVGDVEMLRVEGLL